MQLGEIVVYMDNYNFTKVHQNQMKTKKSFIDSPFFCSEFQSVSRIVKIVHSEALISALEANGTAALPLNAPFFQVLAHCVMGCQKRATCARF